MTGMAATTAEALATLRRAMTCGTPAVEARAALGLLALALRHDAVLRLEQRVAELEHRHLRAV